MVIRRMQTGDIASVAKLEIHTSSMPWSAVSFEEALLQTNNIFFVAEEFSHIAAYAGMLVVPGEGQILNIAVDSQFRRQGIAIRLCEAMFLTGRELGVIMYTLEVRAGNEAALSLYRKLGFVQDGRRKGYYKNPDEDAILMSLK